jgi:predicted negative regulator of RcsB-dependent stress response
VEGARAAYQLAIDSRHPDWAPRAAVNLGIVLSRQGDVEGARAAYQLAIDSGHAHAAGAAQRRLAELG